MPEYFFLNQKVIEKAVKQGKKIFVRYYYTN